MKLSGIFFLLLALGMNAGAGTFSGPTARVGLISGAAGGNDPVFASLTHVWHMEEASGNARADSVGSVALNETGGTVNSAAGVHGNCASFSSIHYLVASSSPYSGDGSLAVWFKAGATDDIALLASQDGDGDPIATLSGGNIIVGTAANGGEAAAGYTANTWQLVIVTYTATDGYTWSLNGGTYDLLEGASQLPAGTLKTGQFWVQGTTLIDDVMIFSTALTQGNVTTLWNSGAGTFYTP